MTRSTSPVRMAFRVGVPTALLLALVLAIVFTIYTPRHASAVAPALNTFKYGPFSTTGDPDGGTCGNTWATDAFNRTFTVNPKATVFFNESFTAGTFTTSAGQSPEACASGTDNGNTVGAGITGKFSGNYFNVVVSNGTYNPNAVCTQNTCNTTAGFVSTIYGPNATYAVNSYDFDYKTAENGADTQDSSDLGGYYGDITGPKVGSSSTLQNHHLHAPGL